MRGLLLPVATTLVITGCGGSTSTTGTSSATGTGGATTGAGGTTTGAGGAATGAGGATTGAGGATTGAGGSGPTGGGGAASGGCTENADCAIRPASCCGMCGAATRTDNVVLPVSQLPAYEATACPPGSGCVGCFAETDPTLIAACSDGTCQLVDWLESPSNHCQANTDCRVRTTSCCECGGQLDLAHLIALPATAENDWQGLACDSSFGCPECAPSYPQNVVAECSGGKCRAVILE